MDTEPGKCEGYQRPFKRGSEVGYSKVSFINQWPFPIKLIFNVKGLQMLSFCNRGNPLMSFTDY